MLRTPLLDLLSIDHPIIQAGMGTFGSGATLAAAMSNAGAIGTIGAAKRSPENLQGEITRLRELTEGPFIVNFTTPWLRLHPEALAIALAARPRAISVSAGMPADLVSRVHDSGALVIAQVQRVEHARQAADAGADIVIAQGAEAGGYGGYESRIGSLALLPQMVDALAPLPVVAAGGITDGRGLAAVLLLGAAGANIGTRFLASVEASVSDQWKQRLVETPVDETLAFGPPVAEIASTDKTTAVPAAIGRLEDAVGTIAGALSSGHGAGAIHSIETASEILDGLVRGAEACLLLAREMVVDQTRAA